MKNSQGHFLLSDMWSLGDKIAEYLRQHDEISMAETAGDIRRRSITAESIDIVAASADCAKAIEIALNMPGIKAVIDRYSDGFVAIFSAGMKLKFKAVGLEKFAAAHHSATGSQAYLENLSRYAAAQGLKVPEAPKHEYDIYKALGLQYIEPELREGLDEVEKAAFITIPNLVTEQDIQGALHIHTSYSDGCATIAEMAAAAKAHGWHYLGIADHSRSAHYAGGLKLRAVAAQRQAIDEYNAKNNDIKVLAGIESDILPDGSLDYPDDILAQFDFVIASVHSAFRIGEEKMTRRFIKAAENKYVTMLGHPTGRMLLKRPEYAVDVAAVIKAAAQTGTLIEINANPRRLDLDWKWCRAAREQGVMLAINPDAHAPEELDYIRYGTAVARKGGLAAFDILNTRSLEEITKIISQKRGK